MLSKETLTTHKRISEFEETIAPMPPTVGSGAVRGFGATKIELDHGCASY